MRHTPTPKAALPLLQTALLFGALLAGVFALDVDPDYRPLLGGGALVLSLVVLAATLPLHRRLGAHVVELVFDGHALGLPRGQIDLAQPHTVTLGAAADTLFIDIATPFPQTISVAGLGREAIGAAYPFGPFIEPLPQAPQHDIALDAGDDEAHRALALALLRALWDTREANSAHQVYQQLPWQTPAAPRHVAISEVRCGASSDDAAPQRQVEPEASVYWPDPALGVSASYLYGRLALGRYLVVPLKPGLAGARLDHEVRRPGSHTGTAPSAWHPVLLIDHAEGTTRVVCEQSGGFPGGAPQHRAIVALVAFVNARAGGE